MVRNQIRMAHLLVASLPSFKQLSSPIVLGQKHLSAQKLTLIRLVQGRLLSMISVPMTLYSILQTRITVIQPNLHLPK